MDYFKKKKNFYLKSKFKILINLLNVIKKLRNCEKNYKILQNFNGI